MTKQRIPMTQRGHDKLTETLQHLKTTRREQISEYMGSAIADGDLRESALFFLDHADAVLQRSHDVLARQLEGGERVLEGQHGQHFAHRHDALIDRGAQTAAVLEDDGHALILDPVEDRVEVVVTPDLEALTAVGALGARAQRGHAHERARTVGAIVAIDAVGDGDEVFERLVKEIDQRFDTARP